MAFKRCAMTFATLCCLVSAPALAQQAAPQAPQAQPAAVQQPLAGAQPGKEAAVPSRMDLKTAVERGLAANPTMQAVRAQLRGAESGQKSALSDFLFTSTASYDWTHQDRKPRRLGIVTDDQDGWGFNLNLNQPLFTGFRILSSYQKARLLKEQTKATLDQAELSLIQSIQTAFHSVLKAREDVKSAQDSVERLKSQLQVTTAFYEVGLKPRLDVLQAEVQLATAQQELLKAQNGVDTQEAQLNTLLNIPLGSRIEYVGQFEPVPFTFNFDQCLERAYKTRPDLVIGQKSVDIAGKDATIAASSFYPQVSAQYNYNRQGDDVPLGKSQYLDNGSRENWNAGVDVQWAFWQWGSTYYSHDQALENVRKMESDLENTRLNAGFEIKKGLLALKEAADRIDVARKSVEAARESYRMALARYQAQVGTNTDVLTAQSDVSNSEAQLSAAHADYANALAGLYVSMGEKNYGLTTR